MSDQHGTLRTWTAQTMHGALLCKLKDEQALLQYCLEQADRILLCGSVLVYEYTRVNRSYADTLLVPATARYLQTVLWQVEPYAEVDVCYEDDEQVLSGDYAVPDSTFEPL